MELEKSCGAVIYMKDEDNVIKFLAVKSKAHSYWGFPKGHVELEETEIETAKREVMEETGLKIVLDENFRYRVQYNPSKSVTKEVIYFLAQPTNTNVSIQKEEILDYKWLDFKEMKQLLTYDNDIEVLNSALIQIR